MNKYRLKVISQKKWKCDIITTIQWQSQRS